MPSQTKVAKVEELKQRLEGAQAAVFADFRGLSVHDANELRTALAEVEAQFAVVKNTLARIAVREAGWDGVEAFLDGPTAVAMAQADPVATAKALVDAAKKFPVLELKGGWAEGRILTADDVKSLAALESREAMLSQVAGLLKAELSRAASTLQALQAKFLRLLDAYKEKVPPGEEDASAEAPEVETDAGVSDAAAGAEAGEEPGEEAAPEEAPAEDGQDEGTTEGEGGS